MEAFINLLVVLAFFVLAVVSVVAVFHPSFDDTLLQRVALSFTCVAALAGANSAMHQEMPPGIDLAVIAGAVYAAECFRIAATGHRRRGDNHEYPST